MRAAIRRAIDSPPPRGAVIVVAVGLFISVVAVLLSRDPGNVGTDVEWKTKANLDPSKPAALGNDGTTQIVDPVLSASETNEDDERLFRIEASLASKAPAISGIDLIRCELDVPRGVHIGQSEGRRAAFPRPLLNAGDDAIKEGTSIDFVNGDAELAGVELRDAFFSYVDHGNPAIHWGNLSTGHHVWVWKFPQPIAHTRVNFAAILVSSGGQIVQLKCQPHAGGASASVRTSIDLPEPGSGA